MAKLCQYYAVNPVMTTSDQSNRRIAGARLHALILLLAWLPVMAWAQHSIVEVITLNYRTAEQVIPALAE